MSKEAVSKEGSLFYFSDRDCMVYRRGGHYRVIALGYFFGMAISTLYGTIRYKNSDEGWCFNPALLRDVPADILVNVGEFIDELNKQ